MDEYQNRISIPERAILADELKSRIRLLQGARTRREGSRYSDAKWRAKLGQSFQTLREICCPHVDDRSSGKNVRRQILEESMKRIDALECEIDRVYGAEVLGQFRQAFQTLEARFIEPEVRRPKSRKREKVKSDQKNLAERGVDPRDVYTATAVKTEEPSPISPDGVEVVLITSSQTTYGCSQSELDHLEQLLDKTPAKADVMEIKGSTVAASKWSSVKGKTKCRRKLDMESVADYLETSDELKKECEPEGIEKLSQLSGDDVLEYFEGNKESTSLKTEVDCQVSSPNKKSNTFEFVDEAVVRDFLKGEGGLTDYTPSQE